MVEKSFDLDQKILDQNIWYKDCVIYELHVRAFYDSNGDGVGDFRGLIKKLNYLSDLGINAIWLLPFYPSPQRDDGYDIANYDRIHANYGNLDDFKELLEAAHSLDIKVITELVLNHTSDQHEWFQRSRKANPGSIWRNFYVWSDDPLKYRGTRIIFKDFELSNWTWDPVAKSYYWHRFYSHQPDLNYDNPEVRKKMLELVDFWLRLGVDGLRLDAVPYLYEREGTSSENLPETHSFLKEIRRHIDENYSNRMLLAEANQWPEDAVAYFGRDDECHMCFHFPLMPRLFMAVRLEDRFSIIDILNQTPNIPQRCQWATFLRNHDELTLEMVTDEERDYMYNVYVQDPAARINLGIRHRMAPLLQNDRRQIELLNGILFALPGTPVIYYGDEIGMGDNIFLGDRNGVRTPFQWSPDRNAGFSSADPQRLYLPVIISSEYHYETVNVENQQKNPNSLLWWMKRLVNLRKQCHALSRGELEFLYPENTRVLAFIRTYQEDTILVVANLSKRAAFVELNLEKFHGYVPVEMFGNIDFPLIGKLPYFITLGPFGFYWFKLKKDYSSESARRIIHQYITKIRRGSNPFREILQPQFKILFEANLVNYLRSRRWYASKSQKIEDIKMVDLIPLDTDQLKSSYALALIEIQHIEGKFDRYLITIGYIEGENATRIKEDSPDVVITNFPLEDEFGEYHEAIYYDATIQVDFYRQLFELFRNPSLFHAVKSKRLKIELLHPEKFFNLEDVPTPTYRSFEQSNSGVIYDDVFFLKLYRKMESGTNPEIDVMSFLSLNEFKKIPPIDGWITLNSSGKEYTLGVIQDFIQNEKDAWKFTIDHLHHQTDELLIQRQQLLEENSKLIAPRNLGIRMRLSLPDDIAMPFAYYIDKVEKMAISIAEMHKILAQDDLNRDFSPEEFTPFYQRSMFQSLRNWTEKVCILLKHKLDILDEQTRAMAIQVIESKYLIYQKIEELKKRPIDACRIRCHGDLHLGQLIYTGVDFLIIDFEGEPARSIGERKIKKSSLRDVAGMMRSFDYAARYTLKELIRQEDQIFMERYFEEWSRWIQIEFLRKYRQSMGDSAIIPKDNDNFLLLIESLLIEKVLYEIIYETNHRPNWLSIPLNGLLEILSPSHDQGEPL